MTRTKLSSRSIPFVALGLTAPTTRARIATCFTFQTRTIPTATTATAATAATATCLRASCRCTPTSVITSRSICAADLGVAARVGGGRTGRTGHTGRTGRTSLCDQLRSGHRLGQLLGLENWAAKVFLHAMAEHALVASVK